MANFKNYGKLCQGIETPQALKDEVMKNAANNRSVNNIGRIRPMRFAAKVALAAALIAALSVTAYAVSRSMNLVDKMSERGVADRDSLETISTQPSEKQGQRLADGTMCLASAQDEQAEYRVLEAVCDKNNLYVHVQIVPLKDDIIFIHQSLDGASPAKYLGIPGLTEGTVGEYAQSQGKTLRVATMYAEFEGENVPDITSQEAVTDVDGSLHIYLSGTNLSGAKELKAIFKGFTYSIDGSDPNSGMVPEKDRISVEASFQDKSSTGEELVFTSFDSEVKEKFGIEIEKLVIEETELGYYATFTWRGENAENFVINMLDENGDYFSSPRPKGGSEVICNDNGSVSLIDGIPRVEHPEKLMFQVVDGELEKHGPYSFQP